MSNFDLILQNEFIKAIESKIKILESEFLLYNEMLEEKKKEPITSEEDNDLSLHFILKIKDKMLQISKELDLYNKIYNDKINEMSNQNIGINHPILNETCVDINSNINDNELMNVSQGKTKSRPKKTSQTKPKNTSKSTDDTEVTCYKFDDGTELCKNNTVTPKRVIKRVDSNKSIMKGKINPVEINYNLCNPSNLSSTNKWSRFN